MFLSRCGPVFSIKVSRGEAIQGDHGDPQNAGYLKKLEISNICEIGLFALLLIQVLQEFLYSGIP